MQNTRFLNGLHGLGVAPAILLIVALAVFAGSALETAFSSIDSVVQLTQQPLLLLRQPNPPANTAHSQPTNQVRVSAAYNSLPLSFEANRGQTDPQVKFVSRGSGYTLFLTSRAEAILALRKQPPKRDPLKPADLASMSATLNPDPASPPAVVRMKLVGASARPRVEGLDELPGKANYFIGNNPKKWRSNVPLFAGVKYRNIYPGVDLAYYGNQRQLEHDFIVAPGADPSPITIAFEGPEKLLLDTEGNLVLVLKEGELRFQRPMLYQEVRGVRHEISGGYVLRKPHEVAFQIAAYDATKPLVIDPVLFYSTYLGGSGSDGCVGSSCLAVDSSGNAYVTGFTESINFPTMNSLQTALAGGRDVFVAKLNATGSSLVYSTYLGGTGGGGEVGLGIAVDAAGSAYVTGYTSSTDFPTMNPMQATYGGGSFDAFVAKLDAAGSSLVYSTYLGGGGQDVGASITVNSSGNAYLTGFTRSSNFPTSNPLQPSFGGGSDFGDGFVAELNPTGTALLYSTYLGGSADDAGQGIKVDSSGNAYVSGFTDSANFPTVNPVQPTFGGVEDGFVAKLNPTGSSLVYSTYLGGASRDRCDGIALDSAGNAYVTGFTGSSNFPTTPGAFQTTFAGGFCSFCLGGSFGDVFVTKLNALGSGLIYSTYLGGSGFDEGSGIAVDSAGNAYIAGTTASTDFPIVSPIQSTFGGGVFDAFVATLNAVGSALVFSTYLGGSDTDVGGGIALDSLPNPNIYVAGYTSSTNFPTTAGAFQTTYGGGGRDAFALKIANIVLPPGATSGKVTGGGTVNVTGGIANFGFIVQAQSSTGPIGGDLQYVKNSVTFTTFTISGNTATFSGACTNNGAPCTFSVMAQDNGEPGTNDSFTISINGGPPEGGTLRSGNIQIHKQ